MPCCAFLVSVKSFFFFLIPGPFELLQTSGVVLGLLLPYNYEILFDASCKHPSLSVPVFSKQALQRFPNGGNQLLSETQSVRWRHGSIPSDFFVEGTFFPWPRVFVSGGGTRTCALTHNSPVRLALSAILPPLKKKIIWKQTLGQLRSSINERVHATMILGEMDFECLA